MAAFAGALGRVEAEEARLELVEGALGVHVAGVALRVDRVGELLTVLLADHHQPVRGAERRLDRVRQARARAVPHHQAVDHRIDVVLLVTAEVQRVLALVLQDLRELHHRAVHPRADVSVFGERLEHVPVEALLLPNHRREHHQARALGERRDRVGDLRRV